MSEERWTTGRDRYSFADVDRDAVETELEAHRELAALLFGAIEAETPNGYGQYASWRHSTSDTGDRPLMPYIQIHDAEDNEAVGEPMSIGDFVDGFFADATGRSLERPGEDEESFRDEDSRAIVTSLIAALAFEDGARSRVEKLPQAGGESSD